MYSITFEYLISWKLLNNNSIEVKYEDAGEEESINLISQPLKAKQIVLLMDEYFALIPEQMINKKTVPNRIIPYYTEKKNLFKPFINRKFLDRFNSRLEYMKAFYMEML
jgi:hypothetical protein